MIGVLISIAIIIALIVSYFNLKKKLHAYQLPPTAKQLLLDNVPFYANLNDRDRTVFESRIQDFLATTSIRGIDTEVEVLDRILIASGAIMLLFSFPDWKYNNLDEVLLYKDSFNKEYDTDGSGRNVLGMVGDGAMHRMMILSRPSLRASFSNPTDGYNTVIHEFAHLIDKADGVIDGVPEYLLSRPYLLPWINNMHATIKEMSRQSNPDINIYGATNEGEFFAVVTEYFFEQPDGLKDKHPELYALLEQMYRPAK